MVALIWTVLLVRLAILTPVREPRVVALARQLLRRTATHNFEYQPANELIMNLHQFAGA
jgi:hypothetical protein